VAKRILRRIIALTLPADHVLCSVEPPVTAASRSRRALHRFIRCTRAQEQADTADGFRSGVPNRALKTLLTSGELR
jgi:hypothetical protein